MRHGTEPTRDPFGERVACPLRTRVSVLGAVFEFESNARSLLRLASVAFEGLPAHTFSAPPHCKIRLFLTRREGPPIDAEVPRMALHAGAGVLCGTMNPANFAVVSPATAAALVAVSRSMLRHPYHVRYELIEFAVYTLASRVQELISMHAACVGHEGRGLLLVGASGAGKSTLSLHCLQQGMEFVAEDGVFVQPRTLRATGVASFLHLPANSSRSLLPEAAAAWIRRSPVIRRRTGVEKFEIDVRRTGYRIARRPPELTGVVFLSRRRISRGPLLLPLRKSELLEKLQASQPYAANQPGWAAFCKRVSRLQAFELRRGRHPGEAAGALRRFLEPGSS
jgi:hypothetical protein